MYFPYSKILLRFHSIFSEEIHRSCSKFVLQDLQKDLFVSDVSSPDTSGASDIHQPKVFFVNGVPQKEVYSHCR